MLPLLVAVRALAAMAESRHGRHRNFLAETHRPWFAAIVLLAGMVALVVGASQHVVLSLEQSQLNSFELMKMDQCRLTKHG